MELPNNVGALEVQANKLYIKLARKYEDSELYYQLKGKLLAKGFNYSDVDRVIENIKKTS